MKHKRSFLFKTVAIIFFIMTLTSCDLFNFLQEKEPDTALEYLKQEFKDSFSDERRLSISNEDVIYTKFYSKKLKKDIVVRDYLNTVDYKTQHSFASNYLFVKYDSKLDFTKDMFTDEFSNTRVIYDFDKLFTYYTERDDFTEKEIIERYKDETKYETAFIIIHATEQETEQLEYRLKSLTHRLYDDYYRKGAYYFVTTPQTRQAAGDSIDYSKITVQELCSKQDLFSSFAKVYKKADTKCNFEEITKIEEIENE